MSDSIRLGVLADTHGRAEACRMALDLLREAGATDFVHCGDIGDGSAGMAVLDALAGTGCRFVWGNNDFDSDRLIPYARDLGLEPMGDWGRFDLSRKRIVLNHGDDIAGLRRLRAEAEAGREEADLLLTGHSHEPHDRQIGRLRWVNPGALFRARPRTCAYIDLARLDETSAVEWIELPA